MIDDLEQEVAELVLEIAHVVPLDGVGDLVGLLDRVGSDGPKLCSRSQGQPVTGVRSAAMISTRRSISRPGASVQPPLSSRRRNHRSCFASGRHV